MSPADARSSGSVRSLGVAVFEHLSHAFLPRHSTCPRERGPPTHVERSALAGAIYGMNSGGPAHQRREKLAPLRIGDDLVTAPVDNCGRDGRRSQNRAELFIDVLLGDRVVGRALAAKRD